MAGPRPIRLANPLAQRRVTLYDAVLGFPRPGRYFLVLLAKGEELARHALQVRPIPPQKKQGPPGWPAARAPWAWPASRSSRGDTARATPLSGLAPAA